jgi:hypothetical protein
MSGEAGASLALPLYHVASHDGILVRRMHPISFEGLCTIAK